VSRIGAVVALALLWGAGVVGADEAPIAGTLKAIDPAAQTLTIEATAKGKTRQVTVHLKPESKIVRFTRATEPGKTGFVEQPVALTDLKPGWMVSITTKHEGSREVAEVVKVVLER
jgi:hypothetical protein